MLIVLTSAYIFTLLDRTALSLALQDIKLEFHLNDIQLGMLTGIASAFFYSIIGLPIARLADKWNRKAIIALASILLSISVLSFSLAGTFLQLIILRLLISTGEAGCVPPAHSLIADYFPRGERPRAVATFKLGAPLALIGGYLGAGWLIEFYGWRTTFVVFGLPGIAVAAAVWYFLYEPRVSAGASLGAPEKTIPNMLGDFTILFGNSAYRKLLIAATIWYFFAFAEGNWRPAFLYRTFGIEGGGAGTWLAGATVASVLGAYIGGWVSSRFLSEREDLQLRICAVIFSLLPFSLLVSYIPGSIYLSFVSYSLFQFMIALTLGPFFASLQSLVPAGLRATGLAALYLTANLIGMGLGPLLVGALSDILFSAKGGQSLRYALMLCSPGFFGAAWYMLGASRTIMMDIERAQAIDSVQNE